ncbi:hypothetical protein MUO32_21100 [Shinella sp. CPCC 101442]|uniref:hypothetical protein n=1 Tax=Shinella sp. CPCC 101442 TaxID=2932265 RepID=UPI0021539918|nr:hypothetical protein [Shinella sp. CPCC 101442]MCR6501539.1 hypothetical protein [Shinella sp. CPCC 101442]
MLYDEHKQSILAYGDFESWGSMHLSDSELKSEGPTLVERLKQLNRKERYWLLQNALVETNGDLPLAERFRKGLAKEIGVSVVPASAWWAMDYHIDWLFSALVLDRFGPQPPDRFLNYENTDNAEKPPRRLIRGTQEDFDLIIGFERTLILVEAKGVTSWGNSQLTRKCERLQDWASISRTIPHHAAYQPPEIYMVLMSPKESEGLEPQKWPDIIKNKTPYFLPLTFGDAASSFLATERCDEQGNRCDTGIYWKMKSRPHGLQERGSSTKPKK